MSRYIDADARDITATSRSVPYRYSQKLDVVEVVRCKDCRYWKEYQEGHNPNELCPWDKNESTDENDYCSYGERREDARNGNP